MKVKALEYERDFILLKVKTLLCMCTTPGQIKRVWPDLLNFMDEEGKGRVLRSKARSPLPTEVCMWVYKEGRGRSRRLPEWRPEALEWMNIIFAETLILPPYEGDPETYPKTTYR